MALPEKVRRKLDDLPNKPGVYLMRDRLGRVIYVGKAGSLKKRVGSYFLPSRRAGADPRLLALVDSIYDFDFQVVRSEPEALLLEGKLIKEYKPKYNVSFRDDKRFLMVKVTRDPFPRFALARLEKDDGCRYFGPFSHAGALRRTMEFILKRFGIRACKPTLPGEREYKHCLNDIIKHCSAPCVGRITPEDYAARLEQACELLEGRNPEFLKELEADMRKAADSKNFELAAQLRDAVYDLRTVRQNRRKFERDRLQAIDTSGELEALRRILNLASAPKVIEGFDISHISGSHTVGSMVRFRGGLPDKSGYRRFRIRTAGASDDYAAMLEIVGRRYRRLRDENRPLPDAVLIDGGRGQLNMARAALERVGVQIPVFGLAKQEEEIYLPDRPEPIDLPKDSPALKLLQRVRDEAHRFANTYHRNWRRKRIRESILDDIPGVGSNRKRLLLEKFGSVERLRRASLEEIAEVVGPRMAAQLKDSLNVQPLEPEGLAPGPLPAPENSSKESG